MPLLLEKFAIPEQPGTAASSFMQSRPASPRGYRLAPQQACRLLQEVLGMFRVDQLSNEAWLQFLEMAVKDRVAGGRIYDAHIAEIACSTGAQIVVTDNRRHFTSLIKHGIRVLHSSEFADEI